MVIYFKNISLTFLHSLSKTPTLTSIPASFNFLTPLPATNGLGSKIPTTTFPMF